ncbi:hypothetical protein [Pseudomonas sp. Marseille-QA0332]
MTSAIHDQAMQYIFKQVLERLLDGMSQAQRASLQLLIQRLMIAAGGPERIGSFRLLVLYSGDPHSCNVLSWLRAAQLSIASRSPATFAMRVLVAPRIGGFGEAASQHGRCLDTLFLQDDPRVELLMVEGHGVVPFCSRRLMSLRVQPAEREMLLAFGHLCEGQPQSLLGCWQLLAQAETCRRVLDWRGGVDALVTGMPLRQRQRLLAWARRCLRLADLASILPPEQCARSLIEGLATLHAQMVGQCLDGASRSCLEAWDSRSGAFLRVIVIDDLMQPPSARQPSEVPDAPWAAATPAGGALSVCFDPLLVAHVHGLHAELHEWTDYAQGLAEAGLSERLSAQQAQSWRKQAERALMMTHAITTPQLKCLLCAPFTDQGARLEAFVELCYPEMHVALPYLHLALQGQRCPEAVAQWLTTASGLPLSRLQALYAYGARQANSALLASLARRDCGLRYVAPQRRGGSRGAAGRRP